MSMAAKQWRRITVDQIAYRWKVQITPTAKGADTFRFTLAIRAIEHPNSKCAFISDEIGYFWLSTNAHSLVVKPKLVTACIRYAVQHGWEPAESKHDFTVTLTRDLLAQLG